MVLNVHYIALGKFDFERTVWVHFFDNYVSTKVMKCNQNKFDFLSFLGIVAQLQIIDGFCCQIFGFQPPETHFNLRKWQIKKYLGHRTTLHWLARGANWQASADCWTEVKFADQLSWEAWLDFSVFTKYYSQQSWFCINLVSVAQREPDQKQHKKFEKFQFWSRFFLYRSNFKRLDRSTKFSATGEGKIRTNLHFFNSKSQSKLPSKKR